MHFIVFECKIVLFNVYDSKPELHCHGEHVSMLALAFSFKHCCEVQAHRAARMQTVSLV